jgi:hypothetical protein
MQVRPHLGDVPRLAIRGYVVSDKPIAPGDLAVVVKPALCPSAPVGADLGHVFQVETVQTLWPSDGICFHCGMPGGHGVGAEMCATEGRRAWSLYRLKRFTPPGDMQEQHQPEEITA